MGFFAKCSAKLDGLGGVNNSNTDFWYIFICKDTYFDDRLMVTKFSGVQVYDEVPEGSSLISVDA